MIDLAFSPCPNDTFMFHALVHGQIPSKLDFQVSLADVEELNQRALSGQAQVSKVSFSAYGLLTKDYVMLPVGAALGYGNGPKIVAKKPFTLDQLSEKHLLSPGRHTTAHLLAKTLLPKPRQQSFCLYHEVVPAILNGEADAGVIIHETRFTAHQHGLVELGDLGDLWYRESSCPLPLGGIVAQRSLGDEVLNQVCHGLSQSIDFAQKNPQESREYILQHSIEKNSKVVDHHIHLFVNEESKCLTSHGREGIESLFRKTGLYAEARKPLVHEWQAVGCC